jgi:hypothetical protein
MIWRGYYLSREGGREEHSVTDAVFMILSFRLNYLKDQIPQMSRKSGTGDGRFLRKNV